MGTECGRPRVEAGLRAHQGGDSPALEEPRSPHFSASPAEAPEATLATPRDRGHRLWGPLRAEALALRCPRALWDTLTDCKKRKVPT